MPLASLRGRVAASSWRRRLAARRPLDHVYTVGVAVFGGLVVAVGLVTVPLPGSGWLTVIAGLFVLSSEFAWAERPLVFTRRHVMRWAEWLASRRLWVRGFLGAGTMVITYWAIVVTLHVVGVPDWVPDAIPLWR